MGTIFYQIGPLGYYLIFDKLFAAFADQQCLLILIQYNVTNRAQLYYLILPFYRSRNFRYVLGDE